MLITAFITMGVMVTYLTSMGDPTLLFLIINHLVKVKSLPIKSPNKERYQAIQRMEPLDRPILEGVVFSKGLVTQRQKNKERFKLRTKL